MSEEITQAVGAPLERQVRTCADPRAIADFLMSAPGMERAAEAMSIADQAALLVAGNAVWDAAVSAEQKRWADGVAGMAKAAADNNDLRVYELLRGLNDALYRA